MVSCLHASTWGWGGRGRTQLEVADSGVYPQKGPRPQVSPGEVNHDVSASLMHLGESEWCHLTPYLEGLCHRLPYLLPYKLPWEPEDPGGRRRGLGIWGKEAPED